MDRIEEKGLEYAQDGSFIDEEKKKHFTDGAKWLMRETISWLKENFEDYDSVGSFFTGSIIHDYKNHFT